MANTQRLDELERELKAFADEFTAVSSDNLFVTWFLRAYLTESDQAAIDAVTGGPGDKSVDAVLIDDKADVVYIVQAKYRRKRYGTAEPRGAVVEFSTIAQTLSDPSAASFAEFLQGMEAAAAASLREARQRILRKKYRLVLIFVTLGKCSDAVERDARQAVRRASRACSLEIIDGPRCLVLLQDYLDGAAPPIPTLDLPLESGAGVKVNGVLQRYDSANHLESWVFSAKGDAIAHIFDVGGRRLFARNIRGFLGDSTPVNGGMLRTLRSEPSLFFYYNNGITIVCDRAEKVSQHGSDVLRVSNPQVINGQQTSRVLAETPGSKAASVLVKVIQVPRDPLSNTGQFDGLVGRIVQATNWQNAIRPSDLMANDRKQLAIEKGLRHREYFYLRKRQTKGEMRAQMRGKKYAVITKEELAQAVAGCELDPTVARSGKDNLFVEQLYDQVFPNVDPNFYLPRYWLFKEVTRGSRGAPQRGYTKWMVLGYAWSCLADVLRKGRHAEAFVRLCRLQATSLVSPLARVIDQIYVQALAYYRANRGRGATEVDISQFFRSKRGRDREFATFWERLPRAKQHSLAVSLAQIRTALEDSQ